MILAGLTLLLGSFAGTFAVGMVISGVSNAQLMGRLNKLEGKIYSEQGVQAKSEKAERIQQAMAEAVIIMKDENIPKEEKMKNLMPLIGKYPDVAFDLIKKVGLKGFL